MDAVAGAVAAAESAKRERRFTRMEAQSLATAIQAQFEFMVQNCKLEPEADGALHAIVAQLLQASSALVNDPQSTSSFETLHGVLVMYPRYFDHPGWRYPS